MNKKNIMQRLVAMSFAIMLMLPIGALADNVQNDVVTGGNDTFTLGGSTTVSYKIHSTNGDDFNGCNAADGSNATVTITVPGGVTATPGSLTFNTCEVSQPVVFMASDAGDYHITVSVSDSGTGSYNINPATFTLHVLASADTTAPTIDFHANETAEATSASGAIVNYESPATHDVVDGAGTATCSPASGSTFALGDTTVTCDAQDEAHNTAIPTTFVVHVKDTQPPTITAPADKTVIATVTLTSVDIGSPTVIDLVDPSPVVTNDAPAGFPIGTTLVIWKATDASGNSATATQTIKVVYKNDGILQPINKDGSSIFKQGSTIPVKFQLRYANGDYVSTAGSIIDFFHKLR